MARTYFLSFLCYLLLAAVMDYLIIRLGIETPMGGAKLGVVLWAGFVATVGFTAYLYSNKKFATWLLDAAYQLVFMVAAGGVLAVWQDAGTRGREDARSAASSRHRAFASPLLLRPPEEQDTHRPPDPQIARHPHQQSAHLLVIQHRESPGPRRGGVPGVERVVGKGDDGAEQLHRKLDQKQIEHPQRWREGGKRGDRAGDRPPEQDRGPDEEQMGRDVDVVAPHHQVVGAHGMPDQQGDAEKHPGKHRVGEQSCDRPCAVAP